MVDFPKIRRQTIRLKGLFKERADGYSREGLDRLLFRRSPKEEYTFEQGRLLLNGIDLLSLIDGSEIDNELLINLVGAVDEYRRHVWNEYGTRQKDFNALTQGFLEKGMNQLGQSYEAMSGGIRIHFNNGRLWINDIDPKVVLALFLSNPNEERRKYLQSVQTKLALILEGRVGKSHSHGVLEEAKRIFVQIARAMENTPSPHCTPLLAAGYAMGG